MPKLVRFYIRHVLIGLGLAVVFVGLLLAFDVGHLRHLVLTSSEGPLALGLLVLFNAIVFSGAQFGIAIMGLGRDTPPRGGRPVPRSDLRHAAASLAPLPVRTGSSAGSERG
ncbi:hypothetical protein EKE94_02200 [Mesobaculum littorinae]|uniref:Uncharacterized protein n=1 Tax=Mesobaculum littorinae TaxID=2486419 RepID=A0A438ALN0_9RHOB|nr:hypothetical protein [Mesobaculum littorinae]RVV99515.1 hypothetical protein EKE94_02200 [Mesobaculum littorinae]